MSGGGPFYCSVKARLAKMLPELTLDAATLATIDLALHEERCPWRADWAARAADAERRIAGNAAAASVAHG